MNIIVNITVNITMNNVIVSIIISRWGPTTGELAGTTVDANTYTNRRVEPVHPGTPPPTRERDPVGTGTNRAAPRTLRNYNRDRDSLRVFSPKTPGTQVTTRPSVSARTAGKRNIPHTSLHSPDGGHTTTTHVIPLLLRAGITPLPLRACITLPLRVCLAPGEDGGIFCEFCEYRITLNMLQKCLKSYVAWLGFRLK